MGLLLNSLATVILGAVGWFAIQFIAAPVRGFFDLRREIRRQTLLFANVSGPSQLRVLADFDPNQLIDPRLEEAARVFRDLGTQMLAFGETEHLAAWFVCRLGYDPLKAGDGLIGLSNMITEPGAERAAHRKTLEDALWIGKRP